MGDRRGLCGARGQSRFSGALRKGVGCADQRIQERGGQASFVVADVAVAKDVERAVSHAIEAFGRLDYAVNNAGYEGPVGSITDFPEEQWDKVLDTNLKGPFLCMQFEARAMLAGGRGGAIVNVGSINSFLGFPGVLRLEARVDWLDEQCLRRVGFQRHSRESSLSRDHRYAHAQEGP